MKLQIAKVEGKENVPPIANQPVAVTQSIPQIVIRPLPLRLNVDRSQEPPQKRPKLPGTEEKGLPQTCGSALTSVFDGNKTGISFYLFIFELFCLLVCLIPGLSDLVVLDTSRVGPFIAPFADLGGDHCRTKNELNYFCYFFLLFCYSAVAAFHLFVKLFQSTTAQCANKWVRMKSVASAALQCTTIVAFLTAPGTAVLTASLL